MIYYMCFQNEVIVGRDLAELEKFVTDVHPQAKGIKATGQHEYLPWDIVKVYVVLDATKAYGARTVAYLWQQREIA